MNRVPLMLLVTFLESFATICFERGSYFYTNKVLGFSDVENLWLALVFGVTYVAGAVSSHPLAGRWGEKRLLLGTIVGQVLFVWTLAAVQTTGVVFLAAAALGVLNGLKWPVVESYVSAGHGELSQSRVVGRFNITWAAAVPLSMLAIGPLLAWNSRLLFVLAGAINVVSLWLLRSIRPRPAHMAEDHPERPRADRLARLRSLMVASRWLMLSSYAMMWIVAALIPSVFRRFEVSVDFSTGLSGLLDLARVSVFIAFAAWAGWRGRTWPVVVPMVLLPAGFFMVCFGPSLWVALVGEVLFGLGVGAVYHTALCYAMAVKNASVDAGGGHEGLIGSGFAVGPAAQLGGLALAPLVGGALAGTLLSVGPMIVLCTTFALLALARGRTRPLPPQTPGT